MSLIINPSDEGVQAALIKAHLKLIGVGLNPPRGLTKTELLNKAAKITGLPYKRTEILVAISDLQAIVDSAIKLNQEDSTWGDCPECNGTGTQEYEQSVPMSMNNPHGYIDTYIDSCDNCAGMGEIELDELDLEC